MDIKFEDYLSDSQIREILESELREQVRAHFKSEQNAERLLSNLAYGMVYDEIDKILPNYHSNLVSKVEEMIKEPSSFNLFNYHYSDNTPVSLGAKIVTEAVRENKELIKSRVIEAIQNRDYSDEALTTLEHLGEEFVGNIYNFVELICSKNE